MSGTKTHFTPELEARIRKVHADNPEVTRKNLAIRFGISVPALNRVLRGEVPRRSTAPKSRPLSPETVAAITRRFAEGEPPVLIARSFGLPLHQVRRVLGERESA